MATPRSPTDTEPDLATWDYFPRGSDGDFARLIPLSRLARQSFNRVIDTFSDDPSRMKHARLFIHFEPTEPDDDDGDHDGRDNDAHVGRWCGYYRLNMDLLPNNPRLGWIVGSGRRDLPEEEVDFLLTPETKEFGVQGRHCRLYRNLQTGVLLIISDGRKVVLDGKDVLCRRLVKGTVGERTQPVHEYQRALHGRTGVVVGDLNYIVEFTPLDEAVQQDQLAKARVQVGEGTSSTLFLSPTPSNPTYEYRGYVVYPVTSGGITSAVAFAYSKATGRPVVIKKMKRGPKNYRAIEKEINMLRALSHENICSLVEVLYSSGSNRGNSYKQNECDEVSLVLTPPAPTMLSAIVGDWPAHIGDQTKERFLYEILQQCCGGLAYMHKEGVMHGDVKPENIGMVTLEPPKIVLIDLGHSEKCLACTDHMKGTLRYLAPEIMTLKQGTSNKPFDNKVDVWALGVTAFEMFTQRRITFELGREENRAWLEQELRPQSDGLYDSLACLIKRMLAWDPYRRIRAFDAFTALGGRSGNTPGGKRQQQDQSDISELRNRLHRRL